MESDIGISAKRGQKAYLEYRIGQLYDSQTPNADMVAGIYDYIPAVRLAQRWYGRLYVPKEDERVFTKDRLEAGLSPEMVEFALDVTNYIADDLSLDAALELALPPEQDFVEVFGLSLSVEEYMDAPTVAAFGINLSDRTRYKTRDGDEILRINSTPVTGCREEYGFVSLRVFDKAITCHMDSVGIKTILHRTPNLIGFTLEFLSPDQKHQAVVLFHAISLGVTSRSFGFVTLNSNRDYWY